MTQPDLIALVGSALSGLGPQGGADDSFRATLKLGEIIRGRVMRSIGEGRYAVNFQGHERVVDSTIPLRTDDILHGRVVAVGDRVELQQGDWERVLIVRELKDRPVPKAEAPLLYEDQSPPKPVPDPLERLLRRPPVLREAGSGRPTKKDRREIERWEGED